MPYRLVVDPWLALNHGDPPAFATKVEASPPARQLAEVAQSRDTRSSAVGDACLPQVAPPSMVSMINPADPTA
jgi:hypothetical protein